MADGMSLKYKVMAKPRGGIDRTLPRFLGCPALALVLLTAAVAGFGAERLAILAGRFCRA
jgi:hypothetical protein